MCTFVILKRRAFVLVEKCGVQKQHNIPSSQGAKDEPAVCAARVMAGPTEDEHIIERSGGGEKRGDTSYAVQVRLVTCTKNFNGKVT